LGTTATTYIAPRNATEVKLAAIWQELLERERIGIKDDFFALGGHSLKAIRLAYHIKKEFGIEFNVKDVFVDPTIESIATAIEPLLWMQHAQTASEDPDTESFIF
jgi:acyl carrier protein